ncbi:hypothetical protein BJX96DRAFT_129841 [Aspergillus floccosus]
MMMILLLFLDSFGCAGLGSDVKSAQRYEPLSYSYYCPPTIMIGTASHEPSSSDHPPHLNRYWTIHGPRSQGQNCPGSVGEKVVEGVSGGASPGDPSGRQEKISNVHPKYLLKTD